MAYDTEKAWRWIAIAASTIVAMRVLTVLIGYDSSKTELTMMPFVASAVWLTPGIYAALGAKRRPALLKGCAGLVVYAALWLVFGNPDLDDGGQWFAFVLAIYYLPVAILVLAISLHTDRANLVTAHRGRTILGSSPLSFVVLAVMATMLLLVAVSLVAVMLT